MVGKIYDITGFYTCKYLLYMNVNENTTPGARFSKDPVT